MASKKASTESEIRMMLFGLFILGGIVLGLTTFNVTGNVVGSASEFSPGILGAVLFVAGVVGMIFLRD